MTVGLHHLLRQLFQVLGHIAGVVAFGVPYALFWVDSVRRLAVPWSILVLVGGLVGGGITGGLLLPWTFRWLIPARCRTAGCRGPVRWRRAKPLEYRCRACDRTYSEYDVAEPGRTAGRIAFFVFFSVPLGTLFLWVGFLGGPYELFARIVPIAAGLFSYLVGLMVIEAHLYIPYCIRRPHVDWNQLYAGLLVVVLGLVVVFVSFLAIKR